LVPIRGSTFDRMCTSLDSRHIRTNEKLRIRNRTSNLLVFGDRVLDHHTSLDLEPLKTVVGAVAPGLFWIVYLHRLTWCSGPILCQWMGWSGNWISTTTSFSDFLHRANVSFSKLRFPYTYLAPQES